MPAGSIMNGCTGSLRPVEDADFEVWHRMMRLGGDRSLTPNQVAKDTAASHLHCVELWMPGSCNLKCRHCYVASTHDQPVLSATDYRKLVVDMVDAKLIDVVIPGMEPLLRNELWIVLDAAGDVGARSVGITTNATLLKRRADRLAESSLTVLNVSVDGPPTVHDELRGHGVFQQVKAGVRAFRRSSDKRMLTNTTVSSRNVNLLVEIAIWAANEGIDYAAFHPFETAAKADNSLAVSQEDGLRGYEQLVNAFVSRRCGSVVIEAEASTFWLIVYLALRGLFDNFDLVIDEAGFLFLRDVCGDAELLVGLNFYPHHYIRTLRITDDAGASSCRSMARLGWHGDGDARNASPIDSVCSPGALADLAYIWGEFRWAEQSLPADSLDWFVSFVADKRAASDGPLFQRTHVRNPSEAVSWQ